MILSKYKGWSIQIQSNMLQHIRLVGRFWWFGYKPFRIPVQMCGHKSVVFETRREARENLPHVRKEYPKAKVVRVTVTITTEETA